MGTSQDKLVLQTIHKMEAVSKKISKAKTRIVYHTKKVNDLRREFAKLTKTIPGRDLKLYEEKIQNLIRKF